MKRLALLGVFLPAAAHAGALGRPNLIDARAVGSGGAFTAVADDPSAVWFNPAGLAQLQRTTILAGFDTVAASFDSTPATCSPPGSTMPSTNCPKISTTTALPLPALAFSTRFAGMNGRDPSRVALGFGTFVTMGGQVDFNKTQLTAAGETPGILHTKLALFEIVPSLAYKVNDVVSVGVSLRAGVMGLGLTDFETATATRPSDATLTGSGAGFGYAVGLLVRPLPALSLGATYRSRLDASVSGNGHLNTGTSSQDVTFDLTVPWPQMVSFGLAYRVLPSLRLMASYDWTDWSGFDAIAPRFSDSNLDVYGRVALDWTDNYTVHFGGEYDIGEHAVVRAGYSYDSNAIPDRTQDRQLIDGPKSTVGAGGGVRLGDRMWIDAAGELLFGSTRTVPTSDMSVPPKLRNVSPGTYQAQVLSFQLTARYQF